MNDGLGWQARAACRGGPLVFYADGWEDTFHRLQREQVALSYCDTCPVVAECFEVFRRDPWAVAGATTPAMRGFDGKGHRIGRRRSA